MVRLDDEEDDADDEAGVVEPVIVLEMELAVVDTIVVEMDTLIGVAEDEEDETTEFEEVDEVDVEVWEEVDVDVDVDVGVDVGVDVDVEFEEEEDVEVVEVVDEVDGGGLDAGLIRNNGDEICLRLATKSW